MAMITESRFTTGIIKCEPRRRWGGTVCGVLVLLLLSALAGWLLHCVRHAALPMAVRIPGLAVLPWVEGSVVGLLGFGSMVVIWKVALWVKRRDDEAMARWGVVEKEYEKVFGTPPPPFSEDLASPSPWGAAEKRRYVVFGGVEWGESPVKRSMLLDEWLRNADPAFLSSGIDHADVGRIVNALLINCCEAEDLLRKSAKADPQRVAGPVYCGNCNALAALMPGPDARHSEAMKRVQGIKSGLSGLARMFPLPLVETRSELGGLPRV